MPEQQRQLSPEQVIAVALNSVPYEWWRHMPLSETSKPVLAVKDALRLAGYKMEGK